MVMMTIIVWKEEEDGNRWRRGSSSLGEYQPVLEVDFQNGL
jgi:hypothetical protein